MCHFGRPRPHSATRVNMRHFLVKLVVWLDIAVDLSSVKHIGELGKCIGGLGAVVLAGARRYGSIYGALPNSEDPCTPKGQK